MCWQLLQVHCLISTKHVTMLKSFIKFLILNHQDLFKDSNLSFEAFLLNFYQLEFTFIWMFAKWIQFEFKTQFNCSRNLTLVSNHSQRIPSNWWWLSLLYQLIKRAHFWNKHQDSSFKDPVRIHQSFLKLLCKLIHLSISERLE